MKIVNTIKYDISKRGVLPVIDAVQGEIDSRVIELFVFSNGVAFNMEDCICSLAFSKPDGTSGWYDTMPDESEAYTISGNVLSMKIAPQVLTVPGDVKAAIRIETHDGSGRTTTFPFVISVSEDPAIDAPKSENYYKVQNWDDINSKFEEIESLLKNFNPSVENVVLYTPQELAPEQQAQARENIGAAEAIKKTVEGSFITLHDSVDAPMEELKVTGTDADTVDVISCGKNLFDIDGFLGKFGANAYVKEGDVYCSTSTSAMIKTLIEVPLGTYTISGNVTDSGNSNDFTGKTIRIELLDANQNAIANIYRARDRMTADNIKYIRLNASTHGTFALSNVMVERGAEATDYEPYKGQTATVDVATQTGWEGLRTYSPVTNIYTNANANIECEYVANIASYIDVAVAEEVEKATAHEDTSDLSITFGEPITILSNTDANASDYEKYAYTFFNIVQVSDKMFYLYYAAYESEALVDEYRQRLLFAYSTDGIHYTRGFPDGVSAPFPNDGNRIFSNVRDTNFTGQFVCKCLDPVHPFRLVAQQHDGTKNNVYLYKSTDGIHFDKTAGRLILHDYHDTQHSVVCRGNIMKVYTRHNTAITNKIKNRQITVSYFDLEGNMLSPEKVLPPQYAYNSAAVAIDERCDLIIPTIYGKADASGEESQAISFELYEVDRYSTLSIESNVMSILEADEGWAIFSPTLLCIDGTQYLAYSTKNGTHNVPPEGDRISRLKVVPITMNRQ